MKRLSPLILLLAGGGLFAYGVLFNAVEVSVEKAPAQAAPPPQPGPPGVPGLPGWPQGPGLPGLGPPEGPTGPQATPGVPEAVGTEGKAPAPTDLVAMTEPDVVYEVTAGGLVRLDDGAISKPYRSAPASACPT